MENTVVIWQNNASKEFKDADFPNDDVAELTKAFGTDYTNYLDEFVDDAELLKNEVDMFKNLDHILTEKFGDYSGPQWKYLLNNYHPIIVKMNVHDYAIWKEYTDYCKEFN